MSEELSAWKKLRSEMVAYCKVFNVRRDVSVREDFADGSEHNFYCIECPTWVNIIPLTANDEVVLIRQYRHGIEELTLEIPGGMADEGEDPQRAAVREMLEETGYGSDDVILVGKSRSNPAIQNNWVYHFLARGVEQKQATAFDTTEQVTTCVVPLNEIAGLIRNGEITHSLVIAAFQHFSLWQHAEGNRQHT